MRHVAAAVGWTEVCIAHRNKKISSPMCNTNRLRMQSLRSMKTSSFGGLIGASGREGVMSGESLHTARTVKWNKQMQGKPKREEVN